MARGDFPRQRCKVILQKHGPINFRIETRGGTAPSRCDRNIRSLVETEVSAPDKTKYLAPATRLDRGSFRRLARYGGAPIVMLFALALAGCGEKAQSQPASPPSLVTVAQPVKRTVTDWDEFTGRFEAIQEVQVRARV